jgi:hypothetical protein
VSCSCPMNGEKPRIANHVKTDSGFREVDLSQNIAEHLRLSIVDNVLGDLIERGGNMASPRQSSKRHSLV